jgi:glutamate-ammonia-ligase adenylyltransferase
MVTAAEPLTRTALPSTFQSSVLAENPGFDPALLPAEAWDRLERLAAASPLYAHTLRQTPAWCLWLEKERNLRAVFRHKALLDEWREFAAPAGPELANDDIYLAHLRRWRRLMSLRVAYRSVNGLADEPTTVGELTRLAEFCLRECLLLARRRWVERLGDPRDEHGRPARFCVLALGKFGGGELNFSSDIDLVYCYEGEGSCHRGGGPTAVTNLEFFTKMAETTTRLLSAQTADGFLFRVDARLRPDGAWGPLVHSVSALENYYATAGQTWERLALLKARPVAGDVALGSELLDDLHGFRYPRHPPPSLLDDVAAMKRRSEREMGGADGLQRDVKRGPGGIREIEFIAQSLQLLNAGRYPFLQTHSTAAALRQLARYELMGRDDSVFLEGAYWFLRRVEHSLQIREERQTHDLPGDPAEFAAIATALGYGGPDALAAELAARRNGVQALFAGLFADHGVDREYEDWWEFFTTERIPPAISSRLAQWFGDAPDAAPALRLFAGGDHSLQITREQIAAFRHLAEHFDALLPGLGQPLETLARLARCAERYGTRRRFLDGCAANPQLLRVLALLCDRSAYSAELLCAHPEILEEVLRPEMLRRRKSPEVLAGELAEGPSTGPGRPALVGWLWLYVRAEQLRALIGELLGHLALEEVEAALTRLADAVLIHLLGRSGPLVVALGKYGGGELSFGSDLDILFISEEGDEPAAVRAAEGLARTLQSGNPLGPIFAVDFRLRPHGDAGPLATTLAALSAYHATVPGVGGNEPGPGGAQTWERQMLVRARVVTGPPQLTAAFQEWRDRLLYSRPPSREEIDSIWAMRERIERERDVVRPPERAFKTGPGGLIDIEFLAQSLQLGLGWTDARLRPPGTRDALRALAEGNAIPRDAAARLLENYNFLRRIEFALRRDANRAVSVLPADPADRRPLARWLGFPDEAAFWDEHVRRLRETRAAVRELARSEGRQSI